MNFDPTLSAFLRSMGVDEQNIYADARQQGQFADNAFQRSALNLQAQGDQNVQSVQNNAEARGVFASGGTARDVGIQQANTARAIESARGVSQDQQSGYMLAAARRVADLRNQQTQQELDARTRLTQRGAQSAYGG